MEIRALTFFTELPINTDKQQMEQQIAPLGKQALQVKKLFTDAGFAVQSLRLASQPL